VKSSFINSLQNQTQFLSKPKSGLSQTQDTLKLKTFLSFLAEIV